MPHRGRTPACLGRHEPEGAQIVVGRSIQVDETCSYSCITATAVKVLVMEPIRKTVSSVTGVADSMFATPWPEKNGNAPSRTTPTARPTAGQRFKIPSTCSR